jgi:hypothetical protein
MRCGDHISRIAWTMGQLSYHTTPLLKEFIIRLWEKKKIHPSSCVKSV